MKTPSNTEYIATFSDLMRIALTYDEIAKENVKKLTEQVVEIIMMTEGVAESLKRDSISGVSRALRQVDMKDDDETVILKTFTGWNPNFNCLHVFIEMPSETFWEDKNRPIGEG